MCPIDEGRLSNITCTWPGIRSCSAGPAPLYGTCSMSQPVMNLNSSPERCTEVPLPEDAMLILPGFALQYAMNSETDFAGNDTGTSITLGERIKPATGAMSRMKLNGKFL